jgi:hypothetical protein
VLCAKRVGRRTFEDQSNLLTEMQVLAGRYHRGEREGRHRDHRASNDCGCKPWTSGAVRTTASGRRGAELQRRAARAFLLHWQRDVCCAEAGRGVDAAERQQGERQLAHLHANSSKNERLVLLVNLYWGSTLRPNSRAASATLGHHHQPFGSARTARGPHGLDLAGACPRLVALDPRWQRQQESRRGWAIGTRLAPGACSEAPERPGIDATISQRRPCSLGRRVPPRSHRTRLGEARWRLRNGVPVPPRHWHPTAMLPALGRATQGPRPFGTRAPFDLVQGGGWLPPPY